MQRGSVGSSLEEAREAAAHERWRLAVRRSWAAAFAANIAADEAALEAVASLAATIREQAGGRLGKEADTIVRYCRNCVDLGLEPRRKGMLDMLFTRRGNGTRGEPTKRCPDCAETVKSAAKVCRFCGYRFEPQAGGLGAGSPVPGTPAPPTPAPATPPAADSV